MPIRAIVPAGVQWQKEKTGKALCYRPRRLEEELDCEDELEAVGAGDAAGAGRDSVTCGLGAGGALGGV
jgi:hypothetical protein